MGPAKRFSDGHCQLLPTGRFLKAADRYIHTSNKYNVSHKFPKRPKTQRFKSSDLMFPIAVNICISVSHWNNVSLGFVQTCEGHVSSNALCHKSQIRTYILREIKVNTLHTVYLFIYKIFLYYQSYTLLSIGQRKYHHLKIWQLFLWNAQCQLLWTHVAYIHTYCTSSHTNIHTSQNWLGVTFFQFAGHL